MEMNPVSKKALDWFNKNQRALPWRKSYDPYQVWVSEAILQQTRMEQGVPYFERFIQRFPTLESLAKAKPEQVLKAWEGLGYYHRAKNLHAAAKIIVEQHQAKIPTTKEELIRLPGFGPYIASAVASIAFEQDEAVVDGNVIRVISRLNAIEENVALPKTKKTIESIAREWLPTGKARNFNQALMELGALICSPRNPKCEICPIQSDCKAVALGKQ